MIVSGGQQANFNYGAFDGQTGLFVGGIVYDVTTGTPNLVGDPIPMTDLGNGGYFGTFTPSAGYSYLIICAVFTDNTYVTVNPDRPCAAYNYDSFLTSSALMNFNYVADGGNSGLTILATVYNITDATQATLNMIYVDFGVYFGQVIGQVGSNYYVTKVPSDSNYSLGIESFQCFLINSGQNQQSSMIATLVGQQLQPGETYRFTQGDTAVLNFIATDGFGNVVNISGATFTSVVKGPNGSTNVVIPNSQHTITSGPGGLFSVYFQTTDTAACGTGAHKDVITQIIIGSTTVWYRGTNVLAVYPAIPLQ